MKSRQEGDKIGKSGMKQDRKGKQTVERQRQWNETGQKGKQLVEKQRQWKETGQKRKTDG